MNRTLSFSLLAAAALAALMPLASHSLAQSQAQPQPQAQAPAATPAATSSAAVQDATASPCVLAGRLDTAAQWAPKFGGLELLDANGKPVTVRIGAQSAKDALAQVKQVRIKQPALLSTCDGNQPLARGEGGPGRPHSSALAVSAGKDLIPVEAIAYPPLAVGGEWVELKLALSADRVTMIPSKRTIR